MRKLALSLFIVSLLGSSLSACGKKGAPVYDKSTEQSKPLKSNG